MDCVKPSVGRIVHYVSHGTPVQPDGSQAFTSQCRAAIVTEVSQVKVNEEDPAGDGVYREALGLCVLNPTGQFFNRGVLHDDGGGKPGAPDCQAAGSHGSPHRYCACGWIEPHLAGGTWHWPERVE
jgi:hypothetical protein